MNLSNGVVTYTINYKDKLLYMHQRDETVEYDNKKDKFMFRMI